VAVASSRRVRVLLVDDQEMIGQAVRKMLEADENIDFCYCQDPSKAISTANEFEPTVILQDLVMPEIDGMMLVKFYRANPKTKDIPLIVLSSKEEAQTKAQAFALGANDYIVKLPDELELLARIRYHSRGYISMLERNEAYELMAAELREAEEYVRELLPEPVAEGEITADWRFIPSSGLGGDAFGYHDIDDRYFALYLLDVCGHGVGAALLSISAMNVVRSGALPGVDFKNPSEVLEGLNDAFPMERQSGKFFSIWYGVYDRQTRKLVFSSGGHPPSILYNGLSGMSELKTPGLFIGCMEGMIYQQQSVVLEEGAVLYLFSDGIFELTSPDNVQLPFCDFTASLGRDSDLDEVVGQAREYQGAQEFEDDYSLVRLVFK